MRMPNVSLTYFVDYVMKAGTPKLTVVQEFKARDEYDPQTDFYKRLREKIVQTLSQGQPLKSLDGWVGHVHEKKRAAYSDALKGLRKAFGRKTLVWFDPPHENFPLDHVVFNINPELGVEIDGTPHIIKLYLKDSPLGKNKAEIILWLMKAALSHEHGNAVLAVLDARRGRLYTSWGRVKNIQALVVGEAASFAAMYKAA